MQHLLKRPVVVHENKSNSMCCLYRTITIYKDLRNGGQTSHDSIKENDMNKWVQLVKTLAIGLLTILFSRNSLILMKAQDANDVQELKKQVSS